MMIGNKNPPGRTQPGVAEPQSVHRRSILKWSSAALLGAVAFGVKVPGLSLTNALAETPGGATSKSEGAVDLGEGDVGVLNYAYALEQLEAAFYMQVLKTPFNDMQSDARDRLTVIRDHEIVHREFFKAALKKAAIPDLSVDFTKVDFNNRDSVLSAARTFEDLGVAAYNGAGKLLKKGEYLLLAGKIVSVEARHAAAIRDLMNQDTWDGSPINDKGLDEAMAPADVLPKVMPYVTTRVTANSLT